MKIILGKLAGVVAVLVGCLLSASEARAASYYDLDEFDPIVSIAAGSSWNDGDFNIATGDGTGSSGYVFGSGESLISALVTFNFQDSDGKALSFLIDFGSFDLTDANASIAKPFNFTEVSGSLSGTGFASLNATGVLLYSIENTGSSTFFLASALLDAESGDGLPGGTSVPDAGATAGLLGVALLAVSAMRKKIVG